MEEMAHKYKKTQKFKKIMSQQFMKIKKKICNN